MMKDIQLTKPLNPHIRFGGRLFLYYVAALIASVLLIDMPSPKGPTAYVATALGVLLFMGLPLWSAVECVRGINSYQKETQSGYVLALLLIALCGFWAIWIIKAQFGF